MKYYLASRTKYRKTIKEIINILNNNGHEIVYDWTIFDSSLHLNESEDKLKKISEDITKRILDIDVFILLSDKEGTDMFIELGIALANWQNNKKSRIYIVGKNNKRSLMHFHPAIIHVDNLIDVFNNECPEIAYKFSSLSNFYNE